MMSDSKKGETESKKRKKNSEPSPQKNRRDTGTQDNIFRLLKTSKIEIEPVVINNDSNPMRTQFDYLKESGGTKKMSAQTKVLEALNRSRVWVDDSSGQHHLFDHLGVCSSKRKNPKPSSDVDNGDYVPLFVLRWKPNTEFNDAPYDGGLIAPVKAFWESKKVLDLLSSSSIHMQALQKIDKTDPNGFGIPKALEKMHKEVEEKYGSSGASPTMELLKKYGFVVETVRNGKKILLPFSDVRCLKKTCIHVAKKLNIGAALEVHKIGTTTSSKRKKRKSHVSGVAGNSDDYGSVSKPPLPLFDVPGGNTYFDRIKNLEKYFIKSLDPQEELKYVVEYLDRLKENSLLDPQIENPKNPAELIQSTQNGGSSSFPKFIDVYNMECDSSTLISYNDLEMYIKDTIMEFDDSSQNSNCTISETASKLNYPVRSARDLDTGLVKAMEIIETPIPVVDARKEYLIKLIKHENIKSTKIPGVTIYQSFLTDENTVMEVIQDKYDDGASKICQYQRPDELTHSANCCSLDSLKILQWGEGSFFFSTDKKSKASLNSKFSRAPLGSKKMFPYLKDYDQIPLWISIIEDRILQTKLLEGLDHPNHVSFVFIPSETRRVPNALTTTVAPHITNPKSKKIRTAVVSGIADLPKKEKNYTLLMTDHTDLTIQFISRATPSNGGKPKHENIRIPKWSLVLLEDKALTDWKHVLVSPKIQKSANPTVDDYTTTSNNLLVFRSF